MRNAPVFSGSFNEGLSLLENLVGLVDSFHSERVGPSPDIPLISLLK